MDDMRAIMQDELRQALAGLLPPPEVVPTPIVAPVPAAAVPPIANPPAVDTPLANNDNAEGATFECC